MKKISLCICAYNEEQNIGALLESIIGQHLTSHTIDEVIVVSSSTDKTDDIVEKYHEKYPHIKLLKEKEKNGKVAAINEFLKIAQHDLCVLCSSDIILDTDCINHLIAPLSQEKYGITGSHPKPLNKKKGILGNTVHILWDLHHRLASKKAKFGECIAFKKVFSHIPNNAVDEEFIAHLVQQEGYRGKYVPEAIVYNYGPETVQDFLTQRRRIHYGHLMMQKNQHHTPPTTKTTNITDELKNLTGSYPLPFLISAILLEAYGRLLGHLDFVRNRSAHTNWKVAQTTKKNLQSLQDND
jgi:cellulose synthase/poly-beta-1,6-N-acetylglucosamine synthase-like glycosyltransferase